ncbi:MAG: hypothetical protein U0R65_12575 [Candidatus Nanopelagicales bacterium]
MDRTARLPRDPACRQLADALWDGVRHTPPLPPAGDGLRGWYLGGPYATVVERRRQRVWQHRRTEPWLTTQWLLERARTPRSYLRYEGLPGQHSYEAAYRAVGAGSSSARSCSSPGSSRSGTTSLQNLVLAAFPQHVPRAAGQIPITRFGCGGTPSTTPRSPSGGGHGGRPRDLVHPAVHRQCGVLALYEGRTDPADVTAEWVRAQEDSWSSLADLARTPGVVVIPFSWLASTSPVGVATYLSERIGVPAATAVDAGTSWDDVYRDRISPEELDNPYLGNLPHGERARMSGGLRDRIADLVGPGADRLDATYRSAIAAVDMISG